LELTTTRDRWIAFLKTYEYDKGNVPEELSKDRCKKKEEQVGVIYWDTIDQVCDQV